MTLWYNVDGAVKSEITITTSGEPVEVSVMSKPSEKEMEGEMEAFEHGLAQFPF